MDGYWFWGPFIGLGFKGLNIILALEVLAISELATPVDYLVKYPEVEEVTSEGVNESGILLHMLITRASLAGCIECC